MSTDTLRDEHEALQRAVVASRRNFSASPDGPFAKAMTEALNDYLGMRQAGVSRDDAVKGIEAVLREAWPHKPSKFGPQCQTCEDTGYVEHVCWDSQRCGRQRCLKLGASFEHRYLTRCGCMPVTPTVDDSIEVAVRSRKPKPRGFSRFGQ